MVPLNSNSSNNDASENNAGDLVLSDIEGYYFDNRTQRYYRLSSAENRVQGVPNWADLIGAPQPSLRSGYDWRDYLDGPVLRRRHPERIENLPFQRLVELLPYGRVGRITMDRSVTALRWSRYGAQRRTRSDLRKRAEMGDFKYASHMVACYKDRKPVIFSVLKKRNSEGNSIGIVRTKVERASNGHMELDISYPETMWHSICDGVARAFTVRNITDGSKVVRCVFDDRGDIVDMQFMRMENTVKSVAFGPSPTVATVGTENSVLMYDYTRKSIMYDLPCPESAQAVVYKDMGGEVFAACGRRGILAFDLRQPGGNYSYRLEAPHCCSMQLLRNDRHMVTSHFGGNLLAYDFRMRRPVDAYKQHVNTTNWTLPVTLDNRERTVAAAGSDGVIRIWCFNTAELLASLKSPYRVREEYQVPRFVHGDNWYGNMGYPAVLTCWMDVMQLSEMSIPQYAAFPNDAY
ncbi:hypothetical protein TTRE_0000000401 [Trichuris trichiura]|uniref:Uncharacterized protein n=1 Tax=Trichuris trichiura TaxID=36087 RepID=A0A077YZD3_TRITR|nr:hypothetical protein TTRE_0000000401 [Trichuris trichiura]